MPSTANDNRSDFRRTSHGHLNGNSSCITKTSGEDFAQPSLTPMISAVSASTIKPPVFLKSNKSDTATALNTTASSSSSCTTSLRIAPSSVLQYQPKSFLQKDLNFGKNNGSGYKEFTDEGDEGVLLADENVITNVNQAALSASLEQKIRGNGHDMQYGPRSPCRKCRRMASKRCTHCEFCAKCGQKDKCEPISVAPVSHLAMGNISSNKAAGKNMCGMSLSVKDRNVQVLGSVMDAAIYHAFRQEDFHSVFSLIQNGMDVNFQRVESDHSSALMAAAHHGRDDAATKLLGLGANPCLEDHTGNKAWNFAERRGHMKLMEKLKKCCEDWSACDGDVDIEMQS